MATLATAPLGRPVVIEKARLDEDVVAWLTAVGLGDAEEVTVLRQAAFGGPLHVRTRSGGEFAVSRAIAARLDVREARER
jgi:ferrous iron transport protein A